MQWAWRSTKNHRCLNSKPINERYRVRNFRDALGFVARLALLAESEGHHPDIELGWGRVAVTSPLMRPAGSPTTTSSWPPSSTASERALAGARRWPYDPWSTNRPVSAAAHPSSRRRSASLNASRWSLSTSRVPTTMPVAGSTTGMMASDSVLAKAVR
jgi:hypothetical protein